MKSTSPFSLLILGILVISFAACKKAKINPIGKNLVLTSFEAQKVFADNNFAIKLFKNLDSSNTSGGKPVYLAFECKFRAGYDQ